MSTRSVAFTNPHAGGRTATLDPNSRPRSGRLPRALRSLLASAFAALLHPPWQPDRASDAAREAIELDLRRCEALGFAGKFSAALVHEISTPLGVITGRIMLALRKLPPDSAARDDLRVMLDQTERVTQVIQHALEPLRVPSPRMSPIDLGELFASILPPFEQLAGVLSLELHVALPAERLGIRGDVAQLARVVTTVLLDALEVTPAGGRVTLAARRCARDGHGDLVEISIADGGPGLSPALLLHAFDPLYLSRAAGHGVSLALANARDVARGHGGDLRVDSEVGAGTIVTLDVPAMQPEDTR